MEFKEYYQLTEDLKAFDENLTSIPKFVGGAATNLASQIARGAGNIAGGLARTGYGGIQAGTGALQALGGGRRTGFKNIKKGLSTATSGLGQTATGATQAVISPVTAALRGAQAATEPLSPRGFSRDRSWAQKTFGLNRWGKEEKKPSRKPSEWRRLVQAYQTTEDRNERVKILDQLKKLDPIRYAQSVRKKTEDDRAKEFFGDLERKHKGVG